MSDLSSKILNFLTSSPLNHITAFSVVYKAMEDNPWIEEDILRSAVNDAVTFAKSKYSNDPSAQTKLLTVPLQFDIAFEGVCSLREIELADKPLGENEIKINMGDLKKKLGRSTTSHAKEMHQMVEKISLSDLSWKDAVTNQVVSDDSDLVKKLGKSTYQSFMKPIQCMQPLIPKTINEKCISFAKNFSIEDLDELPLKLSHDKTWKETEEVLTEITGEILDTLDNIWRNPAFGLNFENTQSEGTYVTDVVVPLLRATLKGLAVKKIALLSTVASADRKGVRKLGKRPDVMFMIESKKKLYELMFVESSRIVCTKIKEEDDNVKLWREMNDGMAWVHKGCKPDKDEFGILGIQIAGKIMHLSVLIKDVDDIHRLFHLRSVVIPIQSSDESVVLQFVETLLLLRNIAIVNISLLLNAPESRSERLKRKSFTVCSDQD
ncbi:hypothetical protein C1645_818478 [Glomus cerebriforme]|uniref:Uncharacterized protein n=1 Tax=Glomus cerebriforme TaxID=658196 RepID=A0A397T7E9_9GLOM|nr:hypothetical protein C1645_818478 [Glomus cerebriforme]